MFYVHIIRSQSDVRCVYTGYTAHVKRRLSRHNKGYCKYMAKYRPWTIVYYCGFVDKYKALAFERYLKPASGIALRNKRLV